MVKNLLPVQEMWIPSLVWEDPLEKEMATYSDILAWAISLTESLADHSLWGHRVRHDLATKQQQIFDGDLEVLQTIFQVTNIGNKHGNGSWETSELPWWLSW